MKMNIASVVRQGLLLNAITLALWPYYGYAQSFNSSLLVGDSSEQEWGGNMPIISPGSYDLDVFVDDEWRGKYAVTINGVESYQITMKKKDVFC
ncbi:Uncharacterised protein [Klebsiella grimontii]|uniref:Fimbriae usher protein StcC n=1 Tax=Klebsiella grimontii TaxID=2058152 RepID=A0A7H4P988_9ENTR|nr:Uncharacterised protein [Klebsiella grimontii]